MSSKVPTPLPEGYCPKCGSKDIFYKIVGVVEYHDFIVTEDGVELRSLKDSYPEGPQSIECQNCDEEYQIKHYEMFLGVHNAEAAKNNEASTST